MKPRALDLFCGAGGATKGLQRAGFHVTGVDIKPQPNYCGDEFIQGDALANPLNWSQWDFIWASPPCQRYCQWNGILGARGHRKEHPDHIDATRRGLQATGRPYVIENVIGAPLHHPVRLTGEMFSLGVHRPRLFESNVGMLAPGDPGRRRNTIAVYGKLDGRRIWTRSDGTQLHCASNLGAAQEAMGIDWMTWDEIKEAIPPAYSEWIGRQILERIAAAV